MILFGGGGDDTLSGGSEENVLIGDYGHISWRDESGDEVARVGGGGYLDRSDGVERNISRIESFYPNLSINNLDSGSDKLYGNTKRDVLIGGGGDLDELYGHNSSDIIIGDSVLIFFDEEAPNLYGLLSIDSHNCTEGECCSACTHVCVHVKVQVI